MSRLEMTSLVEQRVLEWPKHAANVLSIPSFFSPIMFPTNF